MQSQIDLRSLPSEVTQEVAPGALLRVEAVDRTYGPPGWARVMVTVIDGKSKAPALLRLMMPVPTATCYSGERP